MSVGKIVGELIGLVLRVCIQKTKLPSSLDLNRTGPSSHRPSQAARSATYARCRAADHRELASRNDLTGVDAPCSCAIGAGKRAEVVIEGVIFLEDENNVLNLRRARRRLGICGGS